MSQLGRLLISMLQQTEEVLGALGNKAKDDISCDAPPSVLFMELCHQMERRLEFWGLKGTTALLLHLLFSGLCCLCLNHCLDQQMCLIQISSFTQVKLLVINGTYIICPHRDGALQHPQTHVTQVQARLVDARESGFISSGTLISVGCEKAPSQIQSFAPKLSALPLRVLRCFTHFHTASLSEIFSQNADGICLTTSNFL